jgi:peptide-methionine (S)-S-oxide reductase
MVRGRIALRLVTIVGVAGLTMAALMAARGERAAAAPSPAAPRAGLARATFAGGCFWCMEPPFEKLAGVVSVTSGYTGGPEKNPTYEQVSNHATGHAEAIEVLYDPKVVSYPRLLEVFWHNVDPTTDAGQFCDIGHQYRTGIFVHDAEQRRLAEESKRAIEKAKAFKEPVLTPIEAAGPFYAAEEYHQDFYKKSPVRYYSYRTGCGRDRRLKELWGDQAGH